jgi:hypothetical protein
VALGLVLAVAVAVHAEPGLERQAGHVAELAARALDAIEADLEGLPRLARVEVRLVKHAEDIPGAPAWAVGTADPRAGVVFVAARSRDGDLVDIDRTLAHELAHMALERAVGPVPRWLTEGFAYLHAPEVSLARAATLTGAVIARRVVPLERLDETFPAREDAAALAYAEAYDFVAFLAGRGRWPFHNFLAELARGSSLDGAARAAFGRRFVDLEAEWLASVRERYLFYPFALGGASLWAGGAVLLVLGWRRRRRQARAILAQWERDEVQ